MFTCRTLEGVDKETIYRSFMEAFSDYQVNIDLPFWKFDQMMKRRGYIPEKSMGTFKDGNLVGFILNGFREWNGVPTVYDLGTGVIPGFRKQGLTTDMFLKTVEQLKADGVGQYLLEVLQHNTSAFELYKKQGFVITRTFTCCKLDKNKLQHRSSHSVEHVECLKDDDWELLKAFWDYRPSWQNSIESVCAVPESFIYSVVRLDGRIAGYGIIEKKTGDIPQLCVDRNCRQKGIAGRILADLINNTEAEKAAVLNVDDSSDNMKGFLEAMGFDHFADQYEMLLKLDI